jgi:ribosomal protein S27AE
MIHSKQCFKCKTIRPLKEFYKHSGMADGHLNKCKICTKLDVAEHRLENIEKIRAYDRERAKLPERKKASQEVSNAWRKIDKRREKCHSAVTRAIRSGELIRQPCVKCGDKKSLAHHEDYDKPLDVVWLCQPCHKQRHKEIKKGQSCTNQSHTTCLTS